LGEGWSEGLKSKDKTLNGLSQIIKKNSAGKKEVLRVKALEA
jgi:uncharacterized protein YegP (UPF0339 family)